MRARRPPSGGPAPRPTLLALLVLILTLGACGYRPARELVADREPLAVVPGRVFVADVAAVAAAEAGARRALARAGRLASCEPATDAACAHVIVEVLRVEDVSAGVVRGPDGAPTALGLMTRVTARAYLRGASSSTDDDAPIEASATALVGLPDPNAPTGAPLALVARREAARRAAFQVGEELTRRALFLAQ